MYLIHYTTEVGTEVGTCTLAYLCQGLESAKDQDHWISNLGNRLLYIYLCTLPTAYLRVSIMEGSKKGVYLIGYKGGGSCWRAWLSEYLPGVSPEFTE